MSYCRFGKDSDVYLYYHIGGFYCCCACRFAPSVNTVFTKGYAIGLQNFKKTEYTIYDPCPHCKGKGCKACSCKRCRGAGCKDCQIHKDTVLADAQSAIIHLEAHRNAGHKVLARAFTILREEIKEEARSTTDRKKKRKR